MNIYASSLITNVHKSVAIMKNAKKFVVRPMVIQITFNIVVILPTFVNPNANFAIILAATAYLMTIRNISAKVRMDANTVVFSATISALLKITSMIKKQ